MRLLLAAAALLPLVPAQAAAQGWYFVGGNEKMRAYVDLSSMTAIDNKMVGEVQSVYAAPIQGKILAIRARHEINCGDNSFRTLQYSYYDASGTLLDTQASETINERKVPSRGSINEIMMNFVCFRKGGTAVADPLQDARANF